MLSSVKRSQPPNYRTTLLADEFPISCAFYCLYRLDWVDVMRAHASIKSAAKYPAIYTATARPMRHNDYNDCFFLARAHMIWYWQNI